MITLISSCKLVIAHSCICSSLSYIVTGVYVTLVVMDINLNSIQPASQLSNYILKISFNKQFKILREMCKQCTFQIQGYQYLKYNQKTRGICLSILKHQNFFASQVCQWIVFALISDAQKVLIWIPITWEDFVTKADGNIINKMSMNAT